MAKDYIENRNGGYYIAGKRVTLDSIVYTFLDGHSPESIVEAFPAISLEEVYGAIAFYLANRAELDEYLRKGEKEFDRLHEESRAQNPAIYARLRSILDNRRTLKS